MTRIEKQERKWANTIFNEVRLFAYILGIRERFYWFNNQLQLIPYFKKFPREIFGGIQLMRGLTLIYSQRAPRIYETPIGFKTKTWKESESVQERQNASVGRPGERICWSTAPVGRPGPTRALMCQLVGRSGRLFLCHGQLGGRSGSACARRVHRSTGLCTGLLWSPFSLFLASDLYTIFPMSLKTVPMSFYLLYLLSPYNNNLS